MSRKKKSDKELDIYVKKHHEDLVKTICQLCKMGRYAQHHEKPHLWLKCPICGHTKSIKNQKKRLK